MSKNKNELSNGPRNKGDELMLLNKLTRLLEILVRQSLETIRGNRSQKEIIVLLDSVGCGASEIASLLGTTSNTVKVTLCTSKNEKRKK